ncbi:MAG: DUF4143 domain-containing protein [Propionibacteriaceae bacterium]|nr:DUF4143 domain-containing protein [Propionibacteriaceae bacterium]
MPYIERFADVELQDRLSYAGAVLIEGPKFCGKTETATRAAASTVRFDVDESVADKMAIDPSIVLDGPTPRLLDEWQLHPQIWNYVRRRVDDTKGKGSFILTGSANPQEDEKMHSGAGRISRMRMRTLSWHELGYSTGQVSLAELLQGAPPQGGDVQVDIPGIAEKIARGGWPENARATTRNALKMVRDYVDLIAEVDLSRATGGRRRDPAKVQALLKSIARNTATDASIETLTKDAKQESTTFDRNTTTAYLDALERLMIVDDLPAFNATLRSSATLRMTPKRHFTDPSLAVGALGEDIDWLVRDLKYLGFLFESLVVHNLRVYADAIDAQVYFYRDSTGQEVDAIVQKRNGDWAAFEVKLGYGAADAGAQSLLNFVNKIDTKLTPRPKSLTVVTGSGFAHQRADGVNVVPLGILGA